MLEDSSAIAREVGSSARLAAALGNLGHVESDAGNLDRAAQVLQESLALEQERGDMWSVAIVQQALAGVSLNAGRVAEARDLLATIDYAVSSANTDFLAYSLELSACVAADLGEGLRAARLAGAADGIRRKAGLSVSQLWAARIERFLTPARATIAPEVWNAELAVGRALTQRQAATLLVSPIPPQDTLQ